VYATHNQPAEAMDALNTAQNIDGSNPTIYLYRGNVFFNTGQHAAAAEQYQQCLKFKSDSGPTDAVTDRVFAECLKNYQKAQQQLRGR
jgi:Tfp pilus assembly protein PilF